MDAKLVRVNRFRKERLSATELNHSYFSNFYRVMHSKNSLGFPLILEQNTALSILGVYHNQGTIMKMKQLALLLLSLAMLGGFATGCAKSDEDKAKDAIEDAADAVKEAAE